MTRQPPDLTHLKHHPLVISAFAGFCSGSWMAGAAMNLVQTGEIATAAQVLLLFAASILANIPCNLYASRINPRRVHVAAARVALAMSALFGAGALLLMHSRGVLTKGSGIANCPPLLAQGAAFLTIAILAAVFAATFIPAVRRRLFREEEHPPAA